MLEGEPVAQTVQFLPASKTLTRQALADGTLDEYFRYMGLEKITGNIVVIDTLFTVVKPNAHALLQMTQTIRRYLIKNRQSFESVRDKVIALGNLSKVKYKQFYATSSLDEYRSRMAAIDLAQLEMSRPTEALPYIVSSPKGWRTADTFHNDDIKWSGKFESVDARAFPVGTDQIKGKSILVASSMIRQRRRKAAYFLSLLDRANSARAKNPAIKAAVAEFIAKQEPLLK